MSIAILNPNSTEAMTLQMLKTARAACPGVEIGAWTSHAGPPAIQGPEDGAACIPPLLDLAQEVEKLEPQALIIGCADDTGLDVLRSGMSCPVIGIGQAAYHLAALASARFSVVTTLEPSVSILEANVRRYGLGKQLAGVHASGVPVLDLEANRAAATRRVIETILRVRGADKISTIVLGCAGMSYLTAEAADTNIRLIDGVAAAVRIAAALD